VFSVVDAILACLSSPGLIRKVKTFSLGYLLQQHIFAFFLILLTQILVNHLAPVVIIVHALIGHAGLQRCSSTTAIPLFTTLFTTLLTVLSVFPSPDHPNHSQPALTRSQYCSHDPWTRCDRAMGRCSRLHQS
jgi:hypothetical protein